MNCSQKILRAIWRCVFRNRYKKRNIRIAKDVIFNDKTILYGENVIHSGSYISGSIIGRHTFIGSNCFLNNCKIGSFCSIAGNVSYISGKHPTSVFVSTSPVFISPEGQAGTSFVKEKKWDDNTTIDGFNIIVGNDVWIAKNVSILGGVTIGDGAIVAIGAVVTKDVPPYSIVGGIPARVIKYRFTEDQIEFLNKFEWWEKDDQWLISNIDCFSNIEELTRRHKP